MAVITRDCFIGKTIDNQLYTILEKMVEKGYAVDIPSRECFNDLTLDFQLYLVYAAIKSELWTPTQIPTLFWYDAADSATITASGNQVTQVLDKSGNNYTLTREGVLSGPNTGTRTLNGFNVFEWTGDNCLDNNNFTYNQAASPLNIAMIMQVDGGTAQHFLLAGRTTTANGTRMSVRWTTTDAFEILGGSNTGANQPMQGGVTVTRGEPYLIVPKFNSATSSWRVNGSQTNTGNIGTNSFTSIQFGHNESEGSDLDGFIAEVVAFSDAANQEITEGYLAWKWGLQGNLPLTHPYKNSPPQI